MEIRVGGAEPTHPRWSDGFLSEGSVSSVIHSHSGRRARRYLSNVPSNLPSNPRVLRNGACTVTEVDSPEQSELLFNLPD